MRVLIKSFFLIAVLGWIIPLNAQESQDYSQLKKYIGDSRELFEVPGIAVGIIKNGEVIFNHGFGYTS